MQVLELGDSRGWPPQGVALIFIPAGGRGGGGAPSWTPSPPPPLPPSPPPPSPQATPSPPPKSSAGLEVLLCSRTLMSSDRSPASWGRAVAKYPLLHALPPPPPPAHV